MTAAFERGEGGPIPAATQPTKFGPLPAAPEPVAAAPEQVAFRMQLKAGCMAEYKRRHDALWPELASLLREAGVSDYSIFLDEASGALFAVLRRTASHGMDDLPRHPVMRRWWASMAGLMETNADQSPVAAPLLPMFHLA